MSYITAPRSVRVTPAWKRQTPRVNSPVIVTDINGNILRVEHVKEIKRKAKVAKRKATNKRKAKAKRAKVAKVKASRVEVVTPRITRAELDREFMRKLGSVHLDDN
jgi:hypothetical protein